MALSERATRLARQSLDIALETRRRTFVAELSRFLSESSRQGAVGGATFDGITSLALVEIETRKDLAAEELIRASTSTGIRYYRRFAEDLRASYVALTQEGGRMGDVLARCYQNLGMMADANAARESFDRMVATEMKTASKGYADLGHFAESLRTDKETRRREFWSKVLLLVIGAAIGAAVTYVATQAPTWIAYYRR